MIRRLDFDWSKARGACITTALPAVPISPGFVDLPKDWLISGFTGIPPKGKLHVLSHVEGAKQSDPVRT